MKYLFIALVFYVSFSQCVFKDITTQAGLGGFEQQPIPLENCLFPRCVPQGMTGGASVGDYDNDGWMDIYVSRIFERDLLFRNNRDGTFSDTTNNSGLSMTKNHRSNGVLWCDIDNDNDLDLYITTLANPEIETSGNRFYLYVNNGDGTFTEDAKDRGVALDDGAGRYGTSASCGDFNNDGWLDLHVNQWNIEDVNLPIKHTVLFQNIGNGRFMDVSDQHDFVDYDNKEHNFASAFVDMDKDGDQDLIISGDFKTSQYYRNDNGKFVDITQQSRCCTEANGMGITFGDLDKNGYLDWYISSIGDPEIETRTGNRLYSNDGSNVLTDTTDQAGVRYADWGWGTHFLDWDNDSDLDLICTNGQWTNLEKFYTDPTYAWENVDGEGNNMVSKASEIGITDNGVGKSAISFDFDNDGDLDVIISHTGPGIILYENTFNNNNDYLRIKTRGVKSNSYGIGAQITVWVNENDKPLYREMGVGSHYLGHNELDIAHFGLGSGSSPVHRVEVYWPATDSKVVRNNVERNTVLTISENDDVSIESNTSANDDDDDNNNDDDNNSSSSSASIITIGFGFMVFMLLSI